MAQHDLKETITQRQYLALVIPLTLSTLSTPLLGAVDTAVMGRLPDPAFIGGVAIGSTIFNTLFWLFGFFRVSTSGFTAQAHGLGDQIEIIRVLWKPLWMAMLVGSLFIALQIPIEAAAMKLMNPGPLVDMYARQYFEIRIWGSPAALLNYVLLGWLIGSSRVKTALFVQIFMNVTNMVLSLFFVQVMDMEVRGVAVASLIAEYSALVLGLVVIVNGLDWTMIRPALSGSSSISSPVRMLKVNRDLFLRTASLLTVFTMFTSLGARMGETMLAVNAILFQLHFIIAYFFDGLSNAGSIMVGQSIGRKNKALFMQALKLGAGWSITAAGLLMLGLWAGGDMIISLFTVNGEVQRLAAEYLPWIVMFPMVSFWGLILYGIFSGATEAAPVRNSTIASMLIFVTAAWLLIPFFHNHGLWAAFLLFTAGRSVLLWRYLPRLKNRIMDHMPRAD